MSEKEAAERIARARAEEAPGLDLRGLGLARRGVPGRLEGQREIMAYQQTDITGLRDQVRQLYALVGQVAQKPASPVSIEVNPTITVSFRQA